MAHAPAADIRHRREQVVAAAVDLFLVVIKGVDRARPDLVQRHVDRRRVDAERRIRHPREARVRLALAAEDRQLRQWRAVMVELGLLFRGSVGDPIGAGERPVEMIEATVLGIDHDDVLDLAERLVGRSRAGERDKGGKAEPEPSDLHVLLRKFALGLIPRFRERFYDSSDGRPRLNRLGEKEGADRMSAIAYTKSMVYKFSRGISALVPTFSRLLCGLPG